MTDEERYGTISPTPRNPYVGMAADTAGGLRKFMNKAQVPEAVPLVGGMGAGELLVGQAPEEIDRWSYGMTPFVDKNVPGYAGLRGVPEIQTSRTGPLADALFLGADATGVGMGVRALGAAGARGVKRGFNNAISDVGQNASRRQFVKNAGVMGAGAAVAAATPDLLKGLTRTVVKAAPSPTTAAARVAKNSVGSVADFYKTLRGMKAHRTKLRDTYKKEFENNPVRKKEIADIEETMRQQREAFPEQVQRGEVYGDEPDWALDELDETLQDYYHRMDLEASELAQMEYDDALGDFIKANPDYADLPDIDTIHGSKFEDLPPDFLKRTGYLPTDNDVAHHLRRGGEYTDPVTGNTARLIPDAPPPMPGHKGTRFDIEWVSPDGTVSPYQHWLPEYVPDEDIGIFDELGRLKQPSPAMKAGEFPF